MLNTFIELPETIEIRPYDITRMKAENHYCLEVLDIPLDPLLLDFSRKATSVLEEEAAKPAVFPTPYWKSQGGYVPNEGVCAGKYSEGEKKR